MSHLTSIDDTYHRLRAAASTGAVLLAVDHSGAPGSTCSSARRCNPKWYGSYLTMSNIVWYGMQIFD